MGSREWRAVGCIGWWIGCGELCEDVAGAVEMNVGQAEGMEAVEEPVGARGFAEGRSGDADDFELPLTELRLMEVQPMECTVNRGEGCQPCDAALGSGGGGHQYCASRRQEIEEEESLRVDKLRVLVCIRRPSSILDGS